ncbi:ArsR family transcriptional regulator [Streptomyces rapamycinicus]|uniref:DNA-binding transcriptional ArsR family regulator n=1 Tax=Streptomyces rapamycinicus TaxID=1226757 RepID=A0ABR6LTU5_9ACTN|nr:ArsR family transcriptional regulator [Streptomyces rapamycinicus]AGP58080.1 ArsR family transcriptional regulator [Streptomyces rapamycinicus NRRL 5491]MBB4785755.1 DNA-binding transcriptional ArsR family regulator [Streptomyces rapamycinicus]UTO65912.1 ArsR family transcriptional regulator [Streptomyces rapamycinicus]UTP33867.1 ArsR family transcriptional regulator [Streptomyces rapamycinicus NRRL 5491]
MGLWLMDADTLAGSRFVLSAGAETTAALIALARGSAAHPGEQAWLDAHLPAYRARLAHDPVTALLVRAALGRTWLANFLTLTPPGEGEPSVEEELARMRATSPAAARSDLTVSLGRAPLPAALHRDDLPERLADLLEWVWTETVRPTWPRRRRIIEADVVARTGQVSQGGWAAVLDGMRPGMRWLGGSRLQINAHDNPPRAIHGAQLLFVPVTPMAGWVSWDAPHRYAVVYPCAGALAGSDPQPAADPLARLLGPARASVLLLLDTPKSTTHLVALTGQTLGSIGRHLRVLREARLVRRRRAGRSVLYDRTTAGEVLVQAQRSGS